MPPSCGKLDIKDNKLAYLTQGGTISLKYLVSVAMPPSCGKLDINDKKLAYLTQGGTISLKYLVSVAMPPSCGKLVVTARSRNRFRMPTSRKEM
jgi:type IV pilus biogenesis protein CpaD/CtpE